MAKTGVLTVRILSDTKQAEAGLKQFENRVQSTGQKLESAGKKMTVFATLPIAAAMGAATKAASELEQAVGGTEAVFGDASDAIDDYAKKAASGAGLSEREFREATTSIGGQLKRMTGDVDLAAEQSIELTKVASDLAATYGGTTAEAVSALGSAFRGEADPAERFNLNLKIGAVNAKAVELGLAATTNEVDDNARAQATLALIMEQSADAQGQFARESDSAAGSMQIAKAEMENASAEIGAALLPLVSNLAGGVADLAAGFSDLPEPVQNGVLAIAGMVAASGPILTVAGRVSTLNSRLRDADGNFTGAARKAGKFGKALGALAVAGVAYELYQMAEAAREFELNVTKAARATDEELLAAFETASSWSDARGLEFFGELAEANVGTAKRLRDAVAEAGGETSELDRILRQTAEGERRAANDAEAAEGAIDDLGGTSEDTAPKVDELGDANKTAADKTKELEEAIDAVNDAQRAALDPWFAAQDAMDDHREAQEKVTTAEWDIIEAMAERDKAVRIHGEGSDEAREADEKLKGAQDDLEDANRDVIRSAMDVSAATHELSEKMKAGDVSISQAKAQMREWVAQGLLTEEQAANVAEELGIVGWHASQLEGKRIDIPVNADTSAYERAIAEIYQRDHPGIRISVGGGGGVPIRHSGGPMRANEGYIVRGGEQVVETQRPAHVFTPGQQQTRDAGQPVSLGPFNFYYASGPSSPSESAATAARKARFVAGV